MRLWKSAVVLIVVAAAGLLLYGGCESPVPVTVVRPTEGRVRSVIEEQAVTSLPTDYLVSMPIDGWLEPIFYREGDEVAAGEVVARLETADLEDRVRQVEQRIAILGSKIAETSDHRLEENVLVEARATVQAIDETVRAAEAKLAASQAILDFARSELERVQGLGQSDAATARELRTAEMEFRRAGAEHESNALELAALKTLAAVSYIGPKFMTDLIDRKSFEFEQRSRELESARSDLAMHRRNLERAEITAPIDGVVLHRHQTRRQFLRAGTPLLTLGHLDDLEVVAEVLTERAAHLAEGARVEVFGAAIGDEPIEGRVTRVFPAGFEKISALGIEQQRVNVIVALSERPARLGVGFRVDVRIILEEISSDTVLPRSCVYRSAEGAWKLMVVRAGEVAEVEVEPLLFGVDEVAVASGLPPGSQVVLYPSAELAVGTRARPEPR